MRSTNKQSFIMVVPCRDGIEGNGEAILGYKLRFFKSKCWELGVPCGYDRHPDLCWTRAGEDPCAPSTMIFIGLLLSSLCKPVVKNKSPNLDCSLAILGRANQERSHQI